MLMRDKWFKLHFLRINFLLFLDFFCVHCLVSKQTSPLTSTFLTNGTLLRTRFNIS